VNANNAIAAAVTALSLTGLTVLATVATFVDDKEQLAASTP